VRAPRTVQAATELLERYANLTGDLAQIAADRADRIAEISAGADKAAEPKLGELAELGAALEAWWLDGGSDVAGGKKSAELGGCVIGLRMSRAKLAHGFASDDKATEALRGTRWARHTTKTRYSLDRTATLKLLELGGKGASDVAALGFSIAPGADCFFVERAG
jgi:hypothetical protein